MSDACILGVEIYEISEHFVVVTFLFNDAVSQNVAVNVAENVAVNTQQIAVSLGVNRKTIQREMKTLIEYNLIYWDGAAKSGHWEVVQ